MNIILGILSLILSLAFLAIINQYFTLGIEGMVKKLKEDKPHLAKEPEEQLKLAMQSSVAISFLLMITFQAVTLWLFLC